MFGNLKTDSSITEDKDVLGGGGPLDSGIYDTKIDMAYVEESSGGAMGVHLTFKTLDGKSVKVTEWVTSGKAKGQKNYYEDKRTGERRYLPGFNTVNSISLLAIGKEMAELEPEEKTIMAYDFEQRKETPQQKMVITELLGQDITLGLQKVITDRNEKNDAGVYVPSGYTNMNNEIAKVFRTSDRKTVAEIKAEGDAIFIEKWADKNAGQVIDKSAAKAGHNPKPRGTDSKAAGGTTTQVTEEKKSLFGG